MSSYPTDTILCLRTGKNAQVQLIEESKPSTYPEKWFTEHKSKPTLNLPVNDSNTKLETLREIIYAKLGSTIQIEIVIEFLHGVLLGAQANLTAVWKSYDVSIANAGPISPIDLMEVVTVKYKITDSITSSAPKTSDQDNLWICLTLLSVYRLSKISDEVYKRRVSSVIENLIKSNGCSTSSLLNTTASHNSNWINNAEFRKLVAAVDMFFFHFEHHQWSVLRLGTTGSRFRDCASLLSYSHALKMIGATRPVELLRWIFCDSLADEAARIFLLSPNEEYDVQESYFPYQIDFGICMRSAYSARLNPAIHFFCNIIGIMYSAERSLNSRMILEQNITEVLLNAQLVGYVFGTRANVNMAFADVGGKSHSEVSEMLRGEEKGKENDGQQIRRRRRRDRRQ